MWVVEEDLNTSTRVSVNHKFGLELNKDTKGMIAEVWVDINKSRYFDLNNDGIWDAWGDGRDGTTKRKIWFNDQWVHVREQTGRFTDSLELSLDLKTEYTWDGQVWNARPSRRGSR